MKGKKEIIVSTVVVAGVLLTLFFYLMETGEINFDQIVLVGSLNTRWFSDVRHMGQNKKCTKRITRKR